MSSDNGITLRQWTDVVRRARLGRTVKAVALVLSTYADPDGTRVHPGLARIAIDAELTYNPVQEAMATLRTLGFIVLTRKASSRGDADEYRLALPEDLLERVEVLSPAQVKMAAERLRTKRRGKYRPVDPDPSPDGEPTEDPAPHAEVCSVATLHPTPRGADAPDDGALHPTRRGAAATVDLRPAPHGVDADDRPAPHGVGNLHPTPLAPTSQRPNTQELPPNPGDHFRTDLAVVEASALKSDRSDGKCGHGFAIRIRNDGTSACALCRREAARTVLRLIPGGADPHEAQQAGLTAGTA